MTLLNHLVVYSLIDAVIVSITAAVIVSITAFELGKRTVRTQDRLFYYSTIGKFACN